MTELGRIAFDAYRTHVGARAYDGDRMPEWEDIPEELLVRGGWRAAANAVLAEYRSERESMMTDLGELLRAVGMFDGAQPRTPHDLMTEATDRVKAAMRPANVVDAAPASITCSRCGRPLSPSVPAGQVFILADHDCPLAPGHADVLKTTPTA